MKKQNIFLLIASIVIAQLVGIIGSIFTTSQIQTWYVTLEKPFFTPPNWIFGPVWITLYTLIGIALYFVIKQWPREQKLLYLFAFHLVLNALWSIIFFSWHMIELALVDIILMDITLLIIIWWSWRIDKKIFWLLLPYLLWILFATALNVGILLLNL